MRPGTGQMAPASQIARVSHWPGVLPPFLYSAGLIDRIKQRTVRLLNCTPARLHGAHLLMTGSVILGQVMTVSVGR